MKLSTIIAESAHLVCPVWPACPRPETLIILLGRETMGESVYKVIELIGTSTESWEKAASAAIETAAKSLRDLRIAEVVEFDMTLEDGRVRAYRAKVKVSFRVQDDD
jgi:flavin-binding protein dodecin